MNFRKRHEKNKDLVKRVLSIYPSSRNNDWIMIFEALELGSGIEIDFSTRKAIIDSGINVHSLIRQRRAVQKEHNHLTPTDIKIWQKRMAMSKEYREIYSK